MADDAVLSHPEILAHEKLVDILSSRGLPKEELTIKEKDVLVEMFYRFVVPLPQRATNMRRGNRLKKKLCPIKMPKPSDLEKKESKPGCKRKQTCIDQTAKPAKISNYLHDTNNHSPTSDCTTHIVKLTMNCKVKTPVKPIKLSRKCLTPDSQAIHNSSTPHKIIHVQKTGTTRTVSQDKSPEEPSSDSQVESEDEKQKKKFKRTTVTWP